LYDKLQEILSIVKLDDLKSISYKAISNVDLWNNLKDIYSQDFQSHWNLLKEFIRKTYKNALQNFLTNLKNCFEDYQRLNLPEEVNKSVEEFHHLCNEIFSLDFDLLSIKYKFWEILNNFLTTIFTHKGTARKALFRFEPEIENLLNQIAKSYTRIWLLLLKIINYNFLLEMIKNEFEGYDIERKYFETSKTIFSFINDVYNNFQQLKYESGFIEFSDMLIKAKDLLTNFPEITKESRRQIKYLLVDEFQDTDQVQFEIIQQLVPFPSKENEENIPNLFIVGDEKQSIYSFRNADVRVFQKAKEYVAKLNSVSNNDNGLLKLTTTFRLKPEIASFVDLIMSNLMEISDATPYTEFNIKYEPFVIPLEKLSSIEGKSTTVAPITFLFETIGEDSDFLKSDIFDINSDEILDTLTYKEDESTLPYLIAYHIKYIVNNENALIFDIETKSYRKINYSDIAIISRKTKDLAELATVLAKFGIPLLFFGTNNFFASKEIQDVVLFLKFLVDTKDDIALCGILRSIFFGFTDEMLVNIAKTSIEKNVSFWTKLKNYRNYLQKREIATLDEEEYQIQLSRVEFAIETIEKLLPLVSVLPINELIHRILIVTEWHKKVKVFANYEQMLANMDEFLDYAREYVSTGFKTIIDLLDEIDFIARHGLQDVDRFGFVSSNAVNLLTIHSAKGLEFPVVYVHKIDSRTRSPDSIQISRELGLIFPIQITLGGEILKIPTMQNILSTEQLKLEQEAEEARILYVALTRASDYLIITGSLEEKRDKISKRKTYRPKNRLALILEMMNEEIQEPTSNYRRVKDLKFHFTWNDIDVSSEPPESTIKVSVDFIFDLFYKSLIVDHFITNQLPEEEQSEKIYLLDKVQSSISNNLLSSTKLYIYSQDPKNYLKSYFLGIHRSLIEVMKSNLV
ncbi:MAG: UvrD-helicase domain-containing protein, partial [Candidatus Kapaibacteriota bacterium]